MDTTIIHSTISLINDFAKSNPWLDIEIGGFSLHRLVLDIGMDLTSGEGEAKIIFDDVFSVSSLTSWRSNTARQVLKLLEGEEAISITKRFKVEKGYYIFAFSPEDYPEDFKCIIIAKQISYLSNT